MDPHVHRALHMREQLKQIYRARLPHMGWCDDNTRRKQQVWRRSPQNCHNKSPYPTVPCVQLWLLGFACTSLGLLATGVLWRAISTALT